MAANALFEARTSSGGNRAFFSPLSPLAVPLLLKPHARRGRWRRPRFQAPGRAWK